MKSWKILSNSILSIRGFASPLYRGRRDRVSLSSSGSDSVADMREFPSVLPSDSPLFPATMRESRDLTFSSKLRSTVPLDVFR